MIIAILNILMVLFYILFSMIRFKIDVFSPFFYPFFNFMLAYSLPLIITDQLLNDIIYISAVRVQNYGIISFFCGVISFYIINKKRKSYNNYYISRIRLFTVKLFLFLGIILILFYGYKTGIISSLFEGKSIEDLRRKAEIGLGFITEPSKFFIYFSLSMLFSHKFLKKKSMFGVFIVTTLVFIVLFISTGHRSPSIFIILIYLGIYNRFKKIDPIRLLIFSFLIFFSISFFYYLRSGQKDTSSLISKISGYNYVMYNTILYKVNYCRIVELFDSGVIPTLYGKEFFSDMLYFIPRFLWKNKPKGFDYYYKNILGYSFEGGGVPAGIFGSLYTNFKYLGVFIGSFVIGFLYAFFYHKYKNSTELSKIFLYFYIMVNITSVSILFSRLEVMFLSFFIIYIFNKILFYKYNENSAYK